MFRDNNDYDHCFQLSLPLSLFTLTRQQETEHLQTIQQSIIQQPPATFFNKKKKTELQIMEIQEGK